MYFIVAYARVRAFFIITSARNISCQGKTLVSFETLKNQELIFSPFDFNDNSNSPLHDVDPDLQFYNDLYSDSLQPWNYSLEKYLMQK